MISPRLFLTLLVACFTAAVSGIYAASERDVYSVLRKHGIPFDSTAVEKSIAESMVKTADPRSKILAHEDARCLMENKTIAKAEQWPDGICYLKLNGMYEKGEEEVADCLKTLVKDPTATDYSGLIIDIRDAGGSSIESVNSIAGMFVSQTAPAPQYKISDMHGKVLATHSIAAKPVLPGNLSRRMILLINENTAEGSELFALIMKGLSGVTLIGLPTQGDWRLREIIPLTGGESLYISTKKVIRFSGSQEDDKNGVEPDIAVKIGDGKFDLQTVPEEDRRFRRASEKVKHDRELFSHAAGDDVLVRAVDLLLGLKAISTDASEKTATNVP